MRTKHSEYASAQPDSGQRLELITPDVGNVIGVDVIELCIQDGASGRFVLLDKSQALDLGRRLVRWAQPRYFQVREKWEQTGRQATAKVRELEKELLRVSEELRCANNRVETYRKDSLKHLESQIPYKREIKSLSIKLKHSQEELHKVEMTALDLVEDRNRAVLETKEAEAKLAQALDRSAIIADDYIKLRKVAEHNEKVLDQAMQQLKRMAKEAGVELPTPATPRSCSPQQRDGNVMHITEHCASGKPCWRLYLANGKQFSGARGIDFPSIDQAIQWCKSNGFDYCY